MSHYKKLFEETHIGKMKLRNRISMAPMGPVGYANSRGGFNQRLQDYYVERAKNNVGLIITGVCSVDLNIEGLPSLGMPCPTSDPFAFVHSTYPMNERIHAYGSKILLQLTGGLGRSALPGFTKKQIAPSEVENRFEPSITHREMTKDEIMNLIQKFIQSAAIAKKAGFDGMETARVCALRGHDVVLCEKSDHLGGNLIPGGVPHFKRYDLKLVDYYKRQMELQGVEVHLNTEVTADTAKSFQVDIIVCASGSTPKQMTGNGELPVYTADEVLLGKQDASDQIVIIGGGLVGFETALWLAQQGKKVSVVEILPEILGGHGAMPHMNYYMLTDLLNYHKVDIYTDTKVLKTTSDGVVVETDGTQKVLPAKTVIASIGYKENNMLYEQLKDSEIPVYNIGDSRQVHNIMYAIWNAYELARGL